MRYSDWQKRMADYIDVAMKTRFEWGVHDCALLACGCIYAITGKDVAAPFMGRYHDQETAYALIAEYAGGGLLELAEKIAKEFKFEEVHRNFAQRGDVVLVDDSGRDALGVIDFSGRYVMIASGIGIVKRPLEYIKRAWRID